MEKFLCPLCGYPSLDESPYDLFTGDPSFNICPCCGCEYGYNDISPYAKEEFLKHWIKQGTPWFKPSAEPLNWNVKTQLSAISVDYDTLINDAE